MKRISQIIISMLCAGASMPLAAQRSEALLETGWLFHRGEAQGAEAIDYNASKWQSVVVPHDWAITGPFSRDNDLQKVAVTQNFETEASVKTGRTGGLPYVGVGWYRRTFSSTPGKRCLLYTSPSPRD